MPLYSYRRHRGSKDGRACRAYFRRSRRLATTIDVEPLVEIITLTLYTAYLANVERPNSLLVVAEPECGKTQTLRRFIPNKNVAYLSDATAHGLERDYLPKIEAREVRHIILPDLLMPLARKQTTVRTFISFLNALVEEGVASASTYAIRRMTVEPARCGIIAAITGDELSDQRHNWGRLGFLSRTVHFSYSYSTETRKRILDSIVGQDYLNDHDVKLEIPKQDREICLPPRYARAILSSTDTIAKAQKAQGFRLQKQIQSLLMASALERGRCRVNSDDVRRIRNMMNWINLDEHPIDPKGRT